MDAIRIQNPKHRQVYDYVHTAIRRGDYAPGDRVPTDGQLMRQFGASRPTVARAMRELEIAGLLERRPGAGTFVRTPATAEVKLLGLLVPGLGETGIFGPICGEILRASRRHNFHTLWSEISGADLRDRLAQMRQLCRQFIEQKLAGVFFVPLQLVPDMEDLNRQIAEKLDRAGIALVLVDRDLESFPKRSKFDVVGVDNIRVGYMQADYLAGLGHRHIEYLSLPLSAPTVDARAEGYRQAMRRRGLRIKEAWIRSGDPTDMDFVRSLTEKLPDAFACANDWMAANLMRSLLKLGVTVPGDVGVMGVDDVEYASLLATPLTTIRQPCREIGAAAVRAMVERIGNRGISGRNVLLDGELVVRESCGANRQNRIEDNGSRRARPPCARRKTGSR